VARSAKSARTQGRLGAQIVAAKVMGERKRHKNGPDPHDVVLVRRQPIPHPGDSTVLPHCPQKSNV